MIQVLTVSLSRICMFTGAHLTTVNTGVHLVLRCCKSSSEQTEQSSDRQKPENIPDND